MHDERKQLLRIDSIISQSITKCKLIMSVYLCLVLTDLSGSRLDCKEDKVLLLNKLHYLRNLSNAKCHQYEVTQQLHM